MHNNGILGEHLGLISSLNFDVYSIMYAIRLRILQKFEYINLTGFVFHTACLSIYWNMFNRSFYTLSISLPNISVLIFGDMSWVASKSLRIDFSVIYREEGSEFE